MRSIKVRKTELSKLLGMVEELQSSVMFVYFNEGYTVSESAASAEYIFGPIQWAVRRICVNGIEAADFNAAILDTRDRVCEEKEDISKKITEAINKNGVWAKINTDAPYLISIFRCFLK